MKERLIALVGVLMLLSLAAFAQQDASLSVDEMTFCTTIQDRAPAGIDTAFASTVENVYCFTKISGAGEDASVTHIWYYGDREMARVELAVGGSPWRTWSSKKILPEWQGDWRVDIVSAADSVLRSGSFVIRP
jgi:hypothetical protein